MNVRLWILLVCALKCNAWNESDFSKSTPNDEQKLLRFILRSYDRSVRPVWNASHTVVVRLGLTLTQIFNINEKKQILSMNVWLEQAWTDERLQWDPDEFGGVALMTVPTRFLWTPDIVLLNNAQDFSHGIAQTNVNVYPDGSVLWAPPVQSHSVCKLNVAMFPFDQQMCNLVYASWIYDASQVDVTNRSSKINMDNANFIENGEWHVVSTSARRNIRKHPYYEVSYADVTFKLYLRRRVLYYMYNIICPCAMLSALTLLQFWLPCESGEKITLGLTVLLAFSVFSFNIGEKLPETSDIIPLIAIYITCIMGISAVSVGFSVVVLSVKHGGEDNRSAPRWLRFVAVKILARFVCWRRDRTPRIMRRWMNVERNFYRSFRALTSRMDQRESTSFLSADENFENSATTSAHRSRVRSGEKKCNDLSNVLHRTGRILGKLETDLKHEQLMHEWRDIAQIFDRFFFALIASVTVAWAILMLAIAPTFSYTY